MHSSSRKKSTEKIPIRSVFGMSIKYGIQTLMLFSIFFDAVSDNELLFAVFLSIFKYEVTKLMGCFGFFLMYVLMFQSLIASNYALTIFTLVSRKI